MSKSDLVLPKNSKILFQLTGSIACFKACQAISNLVQSGFEVQTVVTPSALEFVGKATLEGLTGKTVAADLFAEDRYMEHIRLARWADVMVLCPATAHSIAKLANGLSDDLVSALFLANNFKKPYLIAPAMNVEMFQHPATQMHISRLREWGAYFVEGEAGALACGEYGAGRLAEPLVLIEAITNLLQIKSQELK